MGPDDEEDYVIRSQDGTLLYNGVEITNVLPKLTTKRGGVEFVTASGGWCAPSETMYDNLIDTMNKGLITDDEMRRQLLGEWTSDDGPEMQDDDPATIVIDTEYGEPFMVCGTYAQIKRISALSQKKREEFVATLERLKQERGHD